MDTQVGGWKNRVYSQKIGNKEKQWRAGSQGLESRWRMAEEASAVKTHRDDYMRCIGCAGGAGKHAGEKPARSRTGS